MTNREFFLARREAEYPSFQGVLKALPADRLDYKPHENSPSAAQLVWTIASELVAANELADTAAIDWSTTPPRPLAEMLSMFEEQHRGLDRRVRTMDDAAWERKGQLRFGGKVRMEPQVGDFLWYLLFDAIHHRGQLSAYIRPMGGKVPAIYGPSADSRS